MDFQLYEAVLNDFDLPKVPKDFLLLLIFRSDQSDTCFPSQVKMAKQLGYSRQRAPEAFKYLRERGLVSTQARGRILMYNLSACRTHYFSQPVRLKDKILSVKRTSTCPPAGHRTRSELEIITIPTKVLETLKAAWAGSGIPFNDYLKKRGYG